METETKRNPLVLSFAVIASLTLAACASSSKAPVQALQAAELSIKSAEQARAGQYAAPELRDARDNLSDAKAAVEDRKMVIAERLAKESRANAELASAKTEMLKAAAINDEMRVNLDTLKQEMQRNTGARK